MADKAGPALPTIRFEVDEARRIATVTLNRPEAMNAISRQLASDLASICERLASSGGIRVAIVKGAGDRAFCAGADLKERRLLSADDRTSHTKEIERAVESLAALPMPTIACIRGFALAGGAEIAVACDMRVAATSSVFGFPEVRIGIFPGAGGVLRLPRLVGGGAARDLLFTGRRIDAEEAYRIGLVDRVAVPDVVEDEAESIALEIAANAPLAVRAVKRALAESAGLSHEIARQQVNLLRAELDASADYEEGLTAFSERRSPRFTGR